MNTYIKKIILKIVSLVVAVAIVLTTMIGCGEETVNQSNAIPATSDGKTTKLVADANVTGELNLSFYGDTSEFANYYLTVAQNKYNELYPNSKINIDYVDFQVPLEDYSTQYAAEAMAGKGPDIFIMQYTMDEYKMSKSGAFVDLTDYFVNDSYFSFDDYNKEAFKACQVEEKQYVVPLTYRVPVFMSTESLIEKSKVDLSKCIDYKSCAEQFGAMYDLSDFDTPIHDGCMIPVSFPLYSGIKWVDYENQTINFNEDFKNCLELIKNSFQPIIKDRYNSGEMFMAVDLKNQKFVMKEISFLDVLMKDYEGISEFDKPMWIPWYNAEGKISAEVVNSVAVNKNCENIDNAYRFIKILLSEECAKSISRDLIGVSVNNSSIDKVIDEYFENEALREDFKKEYHALIREIGEYTQPTQADDYLREFTIKYLKGEISYEECIQSAQSKLEIYISE